MMSLGTFHVDPSLATVEFSKNLPSQDSFCTQQPNPGSKHRVSSGSSNCVCAMDFNSRDNSPLCIAVLFTSELKALDTLDQLSPFSSG